MEPKHLTTQRDFRTALESAPDARTKLRDQLAQKLVADHGVLGVDNARKAAESAIDIVIGRVASADAGLNESATVNPTMTADVSDGRVTVKKG